MVARLWFQVALASWFGSFRFVLRVPLLLLWFKFQGEAGGGQIDTPGRARVGGAICRRINYANSPFTGCCEASERDTQTDSRGNGLTRLPSIRFHAET